MTNIESTSSTRNDFDVIIIGGGVAGLSTARRLQRHRISSPSIEGRNLRIAVLEARSSVGGRIRTERDPLLDHPIELGAEFIHGAPESTLDVFRSHGLTFVDISDTHFSLDPSGRLQSMKDYWEKMGGVLGELDDTVRDRSFAEFLEERASRIDPETRRLLQAFVEGFHAADLETIGTKGLAAAEQASETLQGAGTFRPLRGYDSLVTSLVGSSPELRDHLYTATIAKAVSWSAGSVEIEAISADGRPLSPFRARAAVITLPVGVLKAPSSELGALRFDPEPPGLRDSLRSLEMGHAIRLVFRFRSRFWEGLSDEPLGYLHAGHDQRFPTWWTTMPIRSPLLVAWQGGPKAREMASWPRATLIATALGTLSTMTGRSVSELEGLVQGIYFHDWTHDPFTRGAYSFAGVGGLEATRALTKPIENTLFFAGEATHAGPERGTVDGAMATGERAARQILDALSDPEVRPSQARNT